MTRNAFPPAPVTGLLTDFYELTMGQASGLDRSQLERVFRKGTDAGIDSYSGFFDNGHHRATGLGDILRGEGVGELYLVGIATEYCVKYTALDVRVLGFRTVVVEDGCRGVEREPGDVVRALEEMRGAGVEVLQSHDALAELDRGSASPGAAR